MFRINKILLIISIITSQLIISQSNNALWKSHFSYNNIVDVVSSQNTIYAATDNAIFKYDITTNETSTITTVEGLSGGQINAILYSELFQSLVIGYEDGLIEIYSDVDDSVLTVVDILEKQNITPLNKKINHLYENNGYVYISTDFGISVYDLERLEFGDTYFIGFGGSQISVSQVTVINDQIYAACRNNNGLKRASLNNPNLVDFNQWDTFLGGNFVSVNTLNSRVLAIRQNRTLIEIIGNNATDQFVLDFVPEDTEISSNNYIITLNNQTLVYNNNLQLINTFLPNTDFSTNFSSATILNNTIYIATTDFGILSTSLLNPNDYSSIKPNGPILNEVFRVNAESGIVWATFGEHTETLNPFPLNSRGLSYFSNEEWFNIPFDSLLGARNLTEIAVNPFNNRNVFISSFIDGLLEFKNQNPETIFNQSNSTIESLSPNTSDLRISGSAFDNEGVLWLLNSRVSDVLKRYDPSSGNWQEFDFSVLVEGPNEGELGFFDIAIDNNGTKWIGSFSNGIYVFNEGISDTPLRNIKTEEQNLPFTRVTALELDNRGQLWIGTLFGLRTFNNTSGFYEDNNPTLNSIIILEDGIAQELLANQSITDIKVDGSNNKWVGTVDSGVFYFSPDGQNTIFHFTKDNSPLPTNSINDISIDPNDGTVYIATTGGMLSFSSGGSKPQETLEDAFIYPNPVRPEYDILGFNSLTDISKGIKINGLTDNVNIKITDIEGNLVAEAQSNINLRSSRSNYNFAIDGGTAVWNGRNLANNIVRTGVYLAHIADLDTFETKVLKVLIVR